MPVSTQASQPRISQRGTDTGWIRPELVLQQYLNNTWVDVTEAFTQVGATLGVTGSMVTFRALYRRERFTPSATYGSYRLLFPGREDSINTPQHVGKLSVRVARGGDSAWGIYDLVGTPDGVLSVPSHEQLNWAIPTAQDVVQFDGNWFIEE